MGNDSSTQKHAALWLLARSGDAAELRMAIARVPPELKRSYLEFEHENATALTIAVKRGHVECVRVLLRAAVDANHIGIDGLSALHLAVKKNDPAIVRLLVENDSVDCNVADPHGCTPLLMAAMEGYLQVLDVLLHCGAVNIFARELQTRKDILALARIAYSQAATQNQPRFKACLDLIVKRLIVRSGLLLQYTKSTVGWAWIKRNYAVFRTADPLVVKIDLFPQTDEAMVNPSMAMTWQCSDIIEEPTALASLGLSTSSVSFSEQKYRLSLRVDDIGNFSDMKTIVFAFENQEELEIWKAFPTQLQMAQREASNAIRTRICLLSEPNRRASPQPLDAQCEREILDRQMRQLRLEQQQRRQNMQQKRIELEPGQSSQMMQELESLRIQNRLLQEQEASRREEEEVNRRLYEERMQQEREAKQSQNVIEAQRLCVDRKARKNLEELETEHQLLEQKAEKKLIQHEQETLRLQQKTRREQETRLYQEHILQEQVAFQLEQREHDELEALWAQQARKGAQEAREFQEEIEREREQQQLSRPVKAIPFAMPLVNKAQISSSGPSIAAPVQAVPLTGLNTRSETNCPICLNAPKCAVFIPCGHVAMCMDCATQVKSTTRTCPVCGSSVNDVIQFATSEDPSPSTRP